MKNGKIGVTTENIFPVIKKFLYSDHEIFLRELISNAVDASQKMRTLSSKGEWQGETGDLKVEVEVDTEKRILTIRDHGIGMTADEVDRYINQIAFSGAEEFMAKYQDQAIIGHFGLGFYSSFMVSDKVEIFFRVNRTFERSRINVCDGQGSIASFNRNHMAPGEMEHIVIPKKLLDRAVGDITVSCEEVSE